MNIEQFNLYKTTRHCRKANLTEDDYYENQKYLMELKDAEERYNDEVIEIGDKYTHNQKVISIVYEMYIRSTSDYQLPLTTGIVISSMIALVLFGVKNWKFLDFHIIIPFAITGVIFLATGIYGWHKTRKYKKLGK